MRPKDHPAYDFAPNDKHKLLLQTKQRKPPFCMIGVCFPWEDDMVRFLEDDWLVGEAKHTAERIKKERLARSKA